MRILLLTIFIIINICFAQSAETDSLNTPPRTIGFDKIKHAAVSCLLTLSSQYVMVNKSGFDEQEALYYSVSSAAMVGLAKELNDLKRKDGHFSWGDIIADGVGIAIAVFIITY